MNQGNKFVCIGDAFRLYAANHPCEKFALVLPFERREVVGIGDGTENTFVNKRGDILLIVCLGVELSIDEVFYGVVLKDGFL